MRAIESATALGALVNRFASLYGTTPKIYRAPGRVNLIGEHTDYNDGFVMPAAIGFYAYVAATPQSERKLLVYSKQFQESVELELENLGGGPRHHWSDYVRGVAAVLQSSGHRLCGAKMLLHGEVPIGAGLSSSAAVEVAAAMALTEISGAKVAARELVAICQRAEHEFAGTRCGIMDQFISVFGCAGHALMLDCRSLDYLLLPLPAEVRLVICDTRVKHELAAGEYNRRRTQCEEGVRLLRKHFPHIKALRDVAAAELQEQATALPDPVYRRCRHVISENERVQQAASALQQHDVARFGRLMYASHASLDEDYEVTCRELNLLVELASTVPGVYGARMTGGGFGGCTVNLVQAGRVEEFKCRVEAAYRENMGVTPAVYVCVPAEGAGAIAQD